jgi:hypothetical protein
VPEDAVMESFGDVRCMREIVVAPAAPRQITKGYQSPPQVPAGGRSAITTEPTPALPRCALVDELALRTASALAPGATCRRAAPLRTTLMWNAPPRPRHNQFLHGTLAVAPTVERSAPLRFEVPEDARVWWRWHDGSSAKQAPDAQPFPGWWLPPMRACVACAVWEWNEAYGLAGEDAERFMGAAAGCRSSLT